MGLAAFFFLSRCMYCMLFFFGGGNMENNRSNGLTTSQIFCTNTVYQSFHHYITMQPCIPIFFFGFLPSARNKNLRLNKVVDETRHSGSGYQQSTPKSRWSPGGYGGTTPSRSSKVFRYSPWWWLMVGCFAGWCNATWFNMAKKVGGLVEGVVWW